MKFDAKLISFATQRELDYIEALEKYGSSRKAAASLGVNKTAVNDAMMSLRRRAAKQGYAPDHDMTKPVPDGFVVKGVSTYYDPDGKVRGQWVKSSADEERRIELVKLTIAALVEDIKGKSQPQSHPGETMGDLLAVYPLGDPHIGLHAWGKETGEDFDLNIARQLTTSAVDRLVESAPAAHTAILLPLGDVFHANDQSNQTPAHKHPLDVDGRYVKVLHVGVQVFRYAIQTLLEKHQKVVVRFVSGNHDPQAIWALAFTIAAFFDNEPRVEVDLSPSAHWYYRFGKVLLGATHGDKSRANQLMGVMAADRAEDWGQTRHRHWLCGHVHHSSVQEFHGCTVETFRTLAAADSYAAGYGYRAGRDMRCIVYSSEHGEIERHRADVGMLTGV
jgi:UDP-2,3-diacylglucosamine pyrophosphatase LpxH